MAYTIATGYVALSILLVGFYIRISAIKAGFVRGLSWLTYTKYSVQAMGRIELLGRVWGPETCQPVQGASQLTGNLAPNPKASVLLELHEHHQQ